MKKELQVNLLEGKIVPATVKLALPIIVGHLLMLGYNFADTYFVSGIDKSSTALLSGIGLVFPIYFLFIALATGFFAGMGSLVSRAIGAKDEKTLDRTADSGLLLAIIVALCAMTFVYLFTDQIIEMLAGSKISDEAIRYGKQYIRFIAPGMGCMILSLTLLGILQGEGKSAHYGISMLISTILNIVLDPIFIYVFNMKVAGAALASTIASVVGLLYILSVFVRNKTSIKIHWNIMKAKIAIMFEIMRIGIPQTLGMIVFTISMIFLNKLISSLDESIMNAWVISGRMNELVMLIGYGIGNATLALVGQNFGAGNFSRVKEILKENVKMAFMIGFICVVILNGAAFFLFNLFSDVPEVISHCKFQIRFLSVTGLAVIIEIVIRNAFQGLGKSMPGVIIIFLRMAFLTVPLSYINVLVLGGGMTGILSIMAVVTFSFMFISFSWCYFSIGSLIKNQDTSQIADQAAGTGRIMNES